MEQILSNNERKQLIRAYISNVYDIQKLRISAGNRIVQSLYIQLGIKPSTSPEDADKESVNLINVLKKEYKRITDAVVNNDITTKKAIKQLMSGEKALRGSSDAMAGSSTKPTDDGFILKYITDDKVYGLVSSYMKLLESEEGLIKVLDKEVKAHPLYERFFSHVKGCGTLMSAMCIAYLDIEKARHVSCFWRYCGIDTVQDKDKEGNLIYQTMDGTYRRCIEKVMFVTEEDGEPASGKCVSTGQFDYMGNELYIDDDGQKCIKKLCVADDGTVTYTVIETGEDYVGEVQASMHGRRMGDTEMFEYTDKNGNKAMKRGITYNPVLKTKLMGVLTGCLIKAGDPIYDKIYRDYKFRLQNSSKYADKTAAHINMIAQRFMIKQFLRNLWVEWRNLEGLEVDLPYEVAKLGREPHRLVQDFQYNNAEGRTQSYEDYVKGYLKEVA